MNAEWWSTLESFDKIFWLIAIPSSVAFLIQLIATFFGGDVDADIDIDAEFDADTGIGFQFFTLKNLIAFFAIFSWTGLACIDADLGKSMTIVISITAGLAMMVVMASIFYFAHKLTQSGTLKLSNAVGTEGETYLTIPANRSGYGKVQIKIQGALRDLDALTNDNEDIPTGSIVKVVEVSSNNILTVTRN
ncbi:MAG: hypothetical protein COA58_05780 [Bacteroidetes bacterium]|nr:MAG: hypothetical protein COA58_05780 [Bacteroidota bacterium]